MHSVNSLSNNKIKEIIKLHQKKYRDEFGLFIAEGKNAFEEVLKENIEIVDIYALETFSQNIKTAKTKVITEEEMKKISTTASICEVLVIGKQKPLKADTKKLNKIILLDTISDPGNLGTIIRSAAAFNIDAIILFGDSTELYSPKVIRSSAGNFFKIPIIKIKTINELENNFPSHILISTDLKKANNITIKEIKELPKKILMFGSESQGLSKKLSNLANKNFILNMGKNVESLNLAVSASIIMYELF